MHWTKIHAADISKDPMRPIKWFFDVGLSVTWTFSDRDILRRDGRIELKI